MVMTLCKFRHYEFKTGNWNHNGCRVETTITSWILNLTGIQSSNILVSLLMHHLSHQY